MARIRPMRRSRCAYAGFVLTVIGAGLVSRSPRASGFPDFVTAFAGDTLWALMVFLGLGLLFPSARTTVLAASALGIAFAVEFSQLCEADWLSRIRSTRAGALVLGKGWVATDLLCYAVGVGIGVAGEVAGRKCRVPSAECRVPSAECRVPSAECRVPSAECRVISDQ